MTADAISAEVLAVIVAIVDAEPCVLTLGDVPRLPAGPLLPDHRSLQAATRAWVEQQTGRELGYLEQLYTFADLDREGAPGRNISVSYLGLTHDADSLAIGTWRPWYSLLPWEDRRRANRTISTLARRLADWASSVEAESTARRQRAAITFGLDGNPWQPDLALQRYELLYEAGLVAEAAPATRRPDPELAPGHRMVGDHRRVLATGLARLRAKIQYRPVVFELMAETFTLRELQSCVEALAGRAVHTQNFRRLVEKEALVEETGEVDAETGGRPARRYRFRREILQQRQVAGTKLPTTRAR